MLSPGTHKHTVCLPHLIRHPQLKESKKAVNSIRGLVDEDDDEEEVEKVSWSGEPVGSKTYTHTNTHMCGAVVGCCKVSCWVSLRYLLVGEGDGGSQSEGGARARLPQDQH